MFKLVKPKETNVRIKPKKFWKKYWYIRDAQGNIMATYNKTMSLTENENTYNENLEVLDWSIYGSERLGIIKEENVLLSQREFTMFGTPSNGSWSDKTYTGAASLTSVEQNTFYMVRGNKQYELSNHLGNVLVTVQDRKRSMDVNTNDLADYYVPYLRTVTDYYAFGSSMPGIGGVVPKCTVTQTQTTQTVVDVNEDFNSGGTGGFTAGTGARTVSNPSGTKLHIESLWSTRPLANRTVSLVNGRSYTLDFDLDGFSVVSGYTHTVRVRILLPGSTQTFSYTTSGSKSLTFTSNTTGNVTIEISSLITGSGSYTMNPYIDIDNFELSWEDLVTVSTNSCNSSKNYKYGFNTQERENEIYGDGSSFSAEFWQFDGKLGRRWNCDPDFKYYESPYTCLGNNPIFLTDINGNDTIVYNNSGQEITRKLAPSSDNNVFLVGDPNGSFEWNGIKYNRGFSYYSLFGDPDGNNNPTMYTKINKTAYSSLSDLFDDNLELDRKIYLLDGSDEGLIDRSLFWKESGYMKAHDSKNRGVLKDGGEAQVYEIDGIIYNRRELGMMKWGFVASSLYSSYDQLYLQNSLMHNSVEGNGDEWNEMWAWTFGFMYAKYTSSSAKANDRVAAAKLLTEFKIKAKLSEIYTSIKYPYRSDKNIIEKKDKDGWKTDLKRLLIISTTP